VPTFSTATVTAILEERTGLQRVDTDSGPAYAVIRHVGPLAVGDRVVLNTTAVDLGLGTGGWHVVHWNLARDAWRQDGDGHVMKLRYSSLQDATGVAEEQYPDLPTHLGGMPVVACSLHSQVPCVVAAARRTHPDLRIAYVMTVGAALPLVLSDIVAAMVEAGLVETTITTGHAFGGRLEAVTVASALVLARHAASCGLAVVGMGPGVVGTGTTLGTTSVEVASVLDTAAALGGRPIAAVRASSADRRDRHQGVSHHTRTALDLVRSSVAVAVPERGLYSSARHEVVEIDPGDVPAALAEHGLRVTSMSRGPEDDPLFYAAAGAAGALAAIRAERLLNLTAALLETRLPLTADEIRERVPGYPGPDERDETFRRAFERDKDDLRDMGIPLIVETVPGRLPEIDGYRIPKDDYYLRDPGFESDELAALHLAASAVQLEGMPALGGLLKLGGMVGADAPELGFDVAALPADPNLGTLFGATAERCSVRLTYNGSERLLDPYRLDYLRGRWYLTAFDHLRGEERNYRVDRIDGPVVAAEGERFERPTTEVPGMRLEPWQLGEGEPVIARVRIDGPQASWAVHHLGQSAVVELGEGGEVVVELPVTNPAAFRSFVLSFLEHAEVLSPPDLRDDIIAWLRQVAS
jgi:predicted DNA-binding transcriptional regulator YafY